TQYRSDVRAYRAVVAGFAGRDAESARQRAGPGRIDRLDCRTDAAPDVSGAPGDTARRRTQAAHEPVDGTAGARRAGAGTRQRCAIGSRPGDGQNAARVLTA